MSTATLQGFRLSPQQRRLWQLQQHGDRRALRLDAAVSVEGALDPNFLERALHDVVERHEILRTAFRCLPSMKIPLQVLAAEGFRSSPELERIAGGAASLESAIEGARRAAAHRHVDLERGPLLRAHLTRLAEGRHLLFLSLPALCGDRAGLANLVREIGSSYQALARDEPQVDEPMQYVDLAEWQNELLESPELEAGRAYWQRQDFLTHRAPELPFEQREPGAELLPECICVSVSAETLAEIDARCRELDVALPVFLLSGWIALLWRLCGEEVWVVGTAYDGRKYEDLESALGLFARYLPVSCRIGPGESFRDLLERVGERSREVARWQEAFTWEGAAGDGNETPFFAYCFDFEESLEGTRAAGLGFEVLRFESAAERFRLKLTAGRCDGALSLALHYDSKAFRAEDVRHLAACAKRLLESVSRTPLVALDEIDLLPEEQRLHLLEELADSRRALTDPRPVHELFEEQAALDAERLAVVCEEQSTSYGELNARANRLAHHLRRLGVGPDVPVALSVERGVEAIVGLLGILKAAGAYAPIDLNQPPERQARMLEDLGSPVVVTQERLSARLPATAGQVVWLDSDAVRRQRDDNPPSLAEPCHLVYVLFTSGSTGQPKPVAVEHRQLTNYLSSAMERLDLPAGGSFATVSTFAADLGHTMIFPALCTGGCLHVISQERAADAESLAEYCGRHAIDALKLVPSHLEALLAASGSSRLLPRRRLILGGEGCRWALAEKVRELAPRCRVFNHYGPTEATVGVLTRELPERRPPFPMATLPLERPMFNTEAHVLGRGPGLLPTWFTGELHLAGAGLTRGYPGRPGVTAEKFVPHPWNDDPGARLYKTGDLARRLPGGLFEILGRVDHQVKIRGFRVELGEIEAEILRHEAVREAVVLAHEGRPGDLRLVAYVVAAPGSADTDELRGVLGERLPDYMVPAVFVLLDALPRTPNGKLDRRSLPAPAPAASTDGTPFTAPRTQVEEMLAGLWAELLGAAKVGVDDDFFALGGHSLLATRLISRVRQLFQVEVSLRELFETPTVAGLAASVQRAMRRDVGLEAAPVEPRPRDAGEPPLSYAQQRHWFLQQLEGEAPLYNIRGVVQLEGRLDRRAFERGFQEIVARHEILRTTFPVVDGRPVQRIAPEAKATVSLLDLGGLPEELRKVLAGRLVNMQAAQPFDVIHGPELFRFTLLRLAPEHHVAILTMHHIVADGWSIWVLLGELRVLYGAFSKGEPAALPPLPIQYADFALWQRQWLTAEVLETHLAYWREQLAGIPRLLTLPTDRPRPRMRTPYSAQEPLSLSSVAPELPAFCRHQGSTLFQVLLAAFQVLLARYSGQTDVVVGSPIANRNRLETERLIGCFINAVALRTRLAGNPTFREVLDRVRQTLLGAQAHQDLPFDKLVEELNPERTGNYAPLFQVAFSFANEPTESLTLPGLTLSVQPFDIGMDAKYDLILIMSETGGLDGSLVYSTDLFEAPTIGRMARLFELLLGRVVAQPDARLGELTALLNGEDRRLQRELEKELKQSRRRKLSKVQRRVVTRGQEENDRY